MTSGNFLQRVYNERANAFLKALKDAEFVTHGPTKGEIRENAIRQSLISLIPNDLQVTSGFVIDVDGGITPQIDLLVHSPGTLLPLLLTDRAALLPIELYRFGIEVKSSIDREVFNQVKIQAASLNSLIYSSFIPSATESISPTTFKFRKGPPPFILVALSSDLSIETLKSELDSTPGLHGIVVIDRCLIYRGNKVFVGASDLERVIMFWAYMFQHCIDLRNYLNITPAQEAAILKDVASNQGINMEADTNFRERVLSAIRTPSIIPYLFG